MKSQARLFAESRAKRQQHHIGDVIQTSVFGRMVEGKIIAVHAFGTVDIDTGTQCYRVSGITLSTK